MFCTSHGMVGLVGAIQGAIGKCLKYQHQLLAQMDIRIAIANNSTTTNNTTKNNDRPVQKVQGVEHAWLEFERLHAKQRFLLQLKTLTYHLNTSIIRP